MVTENVILMKMAKDSLKGKWGLAIGTFVVYLMIIGALNAIPILGPLASLFISGPMALGMVMFTLSFSRDEDARLEQIFDGFKNYGTALGAYLLMMIYIILWSLLLIIPGIIAALSYSMTFYIIADEPKIGVSAAIDKSRKMMDGYKWKYFCLQFRFLGWALLCILTLGIGFLWLIPYIYITLAKFYDDVKQNYNANNINPTSANTTFETIDNEDPYTTDNTQNNI